MTVDMKKTIATTFAQMARERPIDKITVKDIVEQCGISRQTFYFGRYGVVYTADDTGRTPKEP